MKHSIMGTLCHVRDTKSFFYQKKKKQVCYRACTNVRRPGIHDGGAGRSG